MTGPTILMDPHGSTSGSLDAAAPKNPRLSLEYGTRRSFSRSVARYALMLAAVTALVALVWYYVVPVSQRVWRRADAIAHRTAKYDECVDYAAAGNAILFDSTHRNQTAPPASPMLRDLDYYDQEVTGRFRCAPGLRQSGVRQHYYDELIPLFLHGRQAPGGHPRLVAVSVNATALADGEHDVVRIEVFSAVRLFSSCRRRAYDIGLGFPNRGSERLLFFSGRPAADDPARFSIEFQCGPRHGVINGSLRQDDTVDLIARWRN